MNKNSGGALNGIRAIELTMGGVGPMCGKILADFGAEVLRVETPQPASGFRYGKADAGDLRDKNTLFVEFNRNKKGILLNLKTTEGVETLKRLVAVSDVLIENLNPQGIIKLGVAYPVLKESNPTLVMISMGGLGKIGPYGHWTTWGPNLLPFAGKTLLWNHPYLDHPVGAQLVHPDYFSGILGATMVLAALQHRARTGEGQYFDYAQVEAATTMIGPQHLDYSVNGRVPGPKGNTSDFMSPHGIYRCKGEDRWVAIAVRNEKEWESFRKAIGIPAWSKSERFTTAFSRVKHRDELDRLVEEWTKKREPLEIVRLLQSYKVPAGELSAAPDLKVNDQFKARNFWVPTDNPLLHVLLYAGEPIRLSDTPWQFYRSSPMLGEHNHEIYDELLATEYQPV